MQAPHTYTREDVVEINCHSGYGVLVGASWTWSWTQGARLAQPGEFTLRAFLSGRLDLTQAEAVLEVIRARTETAPPGGRRRTCRAAWGGGWPGCGKTSWTCLARVEAALDFPEEAEELAPRPWTQGLAGPDGGPAGPGRHL